MCRDLFCPSLIARRKDQMTVWLVRAGKHGEREKVALENGIAVVGWEELPDMTPCKERIELRDLLMSTYPDTKPKTLMNWESQLWPIRATIEAGDIQWLCLRPRISRGFEVDRQ
jgi:restriction system protein